MLLLDAEEVQLFHHRAALSHPRELGLRDGLAVVLVDGAEHPHHGVPDAVLQGLLLLSLGDAGHHLDQDTNQHVHHRKRVDENVHDEGQQHPHVLRRPDRIRAGGHVVEDRPHDQQRQHALAHGPEELVYLHLVDVLLAEREALPHLLVSEGPLVVLAGEEDRHGVSDEEQQKEGHVDSLRGRRDAFHDEHQLREGPHELCHPRDAQEAQQPEDAELADAAAVPEEREDPGLEDHEYNERRIEDKPAVAQARSLVSIREEADGHFRREVHCKQVLQHGKGDQRRVAPRVVQVVGLAPPGSEVYVPANGHGVQDDNTDSQQLERLAHHDLAHEAVGVLRLLSGVLLALDALAAHEAAAGLDPLQQDRCVTAIALQGLRLAVQHAPVAYVCSDPVADVRVLPRVLVGHGPPHSGGVPSCHRAPRPQPASGPVRHGGAMA
mmetsp:Transcript_39528/g.113162  ORF Transcript_39528/g.113162 Transcript_39528/m.113162 type:complete len:437 (+) Transcript_39528:617-1927(+)